MSIKITKRKRTSCHKSTIFSRDLLKGTVFKYDNGVTALRLKDGCVLLKYSNGDDWLDGVDDEESCGALPIAQILGKIVEIIVE